MKNHPFKSGLFNLAMCTLIFFGLSACSSNPMEAIEEPGAANNAEPIYKTNLRTVEYFIYSEKGYEASVDLLMWMPDGAVYKKVNLSQGSFSEKFEVDLADIEHLDLTLYLHTSDRLIRASIRVNDRPVAFDIVSDSEPLLSLEVPGSNGP